MKKKIILIPFSLIIITLFCLNSFAKDNLSTFILRKSSVIVHGSNFISQENSLSYDLKKQIKSGRFIISDKKINSRSLKRENLVLTGFGKSNSVLNYATEIQSYFPLKITEDSFTFNDKVYDKNDNSVIFLYPSPYNSNKTILVYYSNDFENLKKIIKHNIKLNRDYLVFSKDKVIEDGQFDKSGYYWQFSNSLNNLKNDSNNSNLIRVSSHNFSYYYPESSYISKNIEKIISKTETISGILNEVFEIENQESISLLISQSQKNNNLDLENNKIPIIYRKGITNLTSQISKFWFNKYSNINNSLVKNSFIKYVVDKSENNLDEKIVQLYKKNNNLDIIKIIKENDVDKTLAVSSFTKYILKQFDHKSYFKIMNKIINMRDNESERLANLIGNNSLSRIQRNWLYSLQLLSRK